MKGKKTPTYSWEDWTDTHNFGTHVLIIDGQRVAVTSFIGGHVERPDSWYITLRGVHDMEACMSLNDAKQIAEEHFMLRNLE